MIRYRACVGDRAFDDIQAVHVALAFAQSTLRREIVCISQVSRSTREEVGVQRKNNVRFIKLVNGVRVLSKRQSRAFARVVATSRFILMPLCGWQRGEQRF